MLKKIIKQLKNEFSIPDDDDKDRDVLNFSSNDFERIEHVLKIMLDQREYLAHDISFDESDGYYWLRVTLKTADELYGKQL
jgi:hypothetical protein